LFYGLTFPSPTNWNLSLVGTLLLVFLGITALLFIWLALRGLRYKHPVEDQQRDTRSVRIRTPLSARIISALLALVLLLMMGMILGIAGALQGLNNIVREVPVAHVIASPTEGIPHELSVEVILLDEHGVATSDKHYSLDGDLWELEGLFVKLPTWMEFLGFHSGYKVARLSGKFLSSILQNQAHPHGSWDINGGYGDFFDHIISGDSPWRLFVSANYGIGVFSSPGDYMVKASNTGFVAYKNK
jgi:hypothetical protein